MESVIKKAIEGGYKAYELLLENPTYLISIKDVTDPLFWQALGKSCGWDNYEEIGSDETTTKRFLANRWISIALRFHEINLTEGWSKACDYLTSLCK